MTFETRAIHVGQDPDPAIGTVVVPIYQTSAFVQEEVGGHWGYEDSLKSNPTRTALEAALASLEEAAHCLAFASGIAAEDAVVPTLAPGDHVVLGDDVYGGTRGLFEWVLGGVYALSSPTTPGPSWWSTTRSPRLPATPPPPRADVSRTPRPRESGVHLGRSAGGTPPAASRGRSTAGWSCAASRRSPSGWSATAPTWALSPVSSRSTPPCGPSGIPPADHPGHKLALQMDGFGGMVSFTSPREEALRVVKGTSLFFFGESLGGVESLIELPAAITHSSIAGSPFAVSESLIRLSVGIEAVEDLVEDLAAVLE